MALRSILVHVDDSDDALPRIRLAAELAQAHGAMLIGGAGDRPLPPFAAEGVVIVPYTGDEGIKQVRDNLAERQRRFRDMVPAGVDVDWRSDIDDPDLFMIREACAADLLVLGKKRKPGDFIGLDPGSVVLKAGRPVLAVPAGIERLPTVHAMVAWKDSREARRVLADAVPILAGFARVTVVTVSANMPPDKAVEDTLETAASFLSRHGVKAQVRAIAAQGRTGVQLVEEATADGADLIVAGAYGHSRLGEWIFGGVTYELMEKGDFCCLFSH
jgi:nucleotide-binding universal stress UspA family protein